MDADAVKLSVVVAVGHIGRVPANLTTSPVDGTFWIGRETRRPEGQLHSSWRLRVGVSVGCRVPGVGLLQCSHSFAVNGPRKLIWRPIDLVFMVVGHGIAGNGGFPTVIICVLLALGCPCLLGVMEV